jgi:hypothetical protein
VIAIPVLAFGNTHATQVTDRTFGQLAPATLVPPHRAAMLQPCIDRFLARYTALAEPSFTVDHMGVAIRAQI